MVHRINNSEHGNIQIARLLRKNIKMNLPINLVDYVLYTEIIKRHINCVLAEAKGMFICQYLNELEKMAAIFAWEMRELFRPLYDLELKNFHS